MAELVTIRHPDLKADEDGSDPAEAIVTQEAFDLVWSKKGWELVESGEASNAEALVTPTATASPRRVRDNPQA